MAFLFQAPPESFIPETGWGDYFQMLASLLVILLLLVLVMRYVLPALPVTRAATGGLIRIRATVPLEPRKRLYLVETGGKVFLLASSENALSLISDFDPESFPPEPEAPESKLRFADLLKGGRK